MDSDHKCVTVIKESQKEVMLVQQVNENFHMSADTYQHTIHAGNFSQS